MIGIKSIIKKNSKLFFNRKISVISHHIIPILLLICIVILLNKNTIHLSEKPQVYTFDSILEPRYSNTPKDVNVKIWINNQKNLDLGNLDFFPPIKLRGGLDFNWEPVYIYSKLNFTIINNFSDSTLIQYWIDNKDQIRRPYFYPPFYVISPQSIDNGNLLFNLEIIPEIREVGLYYWKFINSWNNMYYRSTLNNPNFTIASTRNEVFWSYESSTPTDYKQQGLLVLVLIFSICFSIPMVYYTNHLLIEKQKKHHAIANLMGYRSWKIYLADYFSFFVLFFICFLLVFCISMFASEFKDKAGKLFILWFLYGVSMISFSVFISSFFWSPIKSMVFNYIFVFFAPLIILGIVFFSDHSINSYLFFLPIFSLQFGIIYIFIFNEFITGGVSIFGKIIGSLIIQSIVYFIVALYLNDVLPKDYGYTYHWTYPYGFVKRYFKKLFHKSQEITDQSLSIDILNNRSDVDEDCKIERKLAYDLNQSFIFRSMDLCKVYKNGKEALTDFSLTGKQGEVIGLLGPNGAGKTTFIHLLCGIYRPTSGDAIINGFSITDQLDQVYQHLNFCSQFDILYNDLTVFDHLEYYYNLKRKDQMTSNEINDAISSIIDLVQLTEYKYKKIRECSGGTKRRVSIAISLVGDSKLILLDEPTTGLDIENKKIVWKIIQEIKKERSILLTTHDIDEAEVLCDRVALISNGELKRVGQLSYLKSKFDSKYKISIKTTNSQYSNEIRDLIHYKNPNIQFKLTVTNNSLSILIPKDCNVQYIFELIKQKEQYGIIDSKIEQFSLKDIFTETFK